VCSCDFPFFPKKTVFFANAGSKKKSPASAAISAADLNFRVTTLLAGKPAARPLPEWIGERTLLTVGDRLRLLGVCAFHRGCSQGMACPFLAAVLHHQRLSESGDPGKSCPAQSI
jgi:molybdopterin-guanine dinucleotide biosynthesis protein A